MYFMDGKPVAANGGVQLLAGRPPIVVMSHRAALRMRAFVMMSPIEVAGFGLLEHQYSEDGNGPDRLVVTDTHIMQQDCTSGSALLTPQGFFELQDRLEKKYGKVMDKDMRVWWHSHGNIGIDWSTTDTGTMGEYTVDVELLCLLTNRATADLSKNRFADETLACYVSGPPSRIAWNGLFIGLEKPKEGDSDQAILEEAIEDFHGSIRNLPTEVKPQAKDGQLVVEYEPLQTKVVPIEGETKPEPAKPAETPVTQGDEEVPA